MWVWFRDIKTSNILMKNELGECAVADLGLALKLVPTDDPSEISNHGQVSSHTPPLYHVM